MTTDYYYAYTTVGNCLMLELGEDVNTVDGSSACHAAYALLVAQACEKLCMNTGR